MLRWTGIVVLAIAALGLLVAVVGLLLPRAHVASRSAVVACPPGDVFDAVRDVAGAGAWRTGVSRIEMLAPVDGRVRWVEVSGRDRVTMEMVEARAPDRVVIRIADSDLPFGGTWTIDITRQDPGTAVTITERGEIYNPIFRALARFVFGYTTAMETYLRDLTVRCS